MIRKISLHEPKYGNYFLATEAPGDKPGANVTKTTNTPNDDDPMDFNGIGVDDNTDDRNIENTQGNQEDTDTDTSDFNGTGIDDETPDPQPTEEEQPTDATDNVDEPTTNTPTDTEGDTTVDAATDQGEGDTPPPTEGDTETVPADSAEAEGETDASSDFNAVGDGGDEAAPDGDGQDTNTNDEGDDQNKKGPGLEYDSTRKYNLFKEYMSLYNAVDNYVSKLESNIKDDTRANQILKIATNNLREIRDLTYDYMIIKFEISTYIQSLVFYQKLVVSVQLVFNLINEMSKKPAI